MGTKDRRGTRRVGPGRGCRERRYSYSQRMGRRSQTSEGLICSREEVGCGRRETKDVEKVESLVGGHIK